MVAACACYTCEGSTRCPQPAVSAKISGLGSAWRVLARQGVPHGTPQVRVMMISPVDSLTIERTNERLQGIGPSALPAVVSRHTPGLADLTSACVPWIVPLLSRFLHTYLSNDSRGKNFAHGGERQCRGCSQ